MRCLLVLWFIGCLGAYVIAKEYEDNDFAEFEMFEEEDVIEEEEEVQSKAEEAQPEQVREKYHETVMQDDDEEAMVEEEDEIDEFNQYDEDEFVLPVNDEKSSGSKKNQKEPQIRIVSVPPHLRSNWDSFYLEMLMVAGLVVYFINFIVGKSKNQKLANVWYSSHMSLLDQNFALVGDDGKKPIENPGIHKESENVYTLWCSGRANVEGMLVELKFIKRQDMIGVISQLIRPSCDQLIVKVTLDELDTFVFCMATKKTAAKLSKDMTDISSFCPEKKAVDKYGLGSNFVVMCEIGEVASAVLGDPKITAIINKFPGLLDYLHFSDQYSGPKQPEETQPTKLPEIQKMLIFGFNFPGRGNPTVEDIEGMKPLMQLVFHITDKLRRFKLSKEAKSKAGKNRQRMEEAYLKATLAVRAEVAQAKREEKKRQERETMLEADDPDRQRKWEEREQKRNMKKRAPKMKQLRA